MSVRSGLVLGGQRQIANPFLLCALISKRTRQLMLARNGSTNTAQIIDFALEELISGELAFKIAGRKYSFGLPTEAEEREEEQCDELAAPRLPDTFSAAHSVELT